MSKYVEETDELGRTMTLLKAIEQIEKLECELERTEKQLKIAVKAFKDIIKEDMYNLDEHRVFIEETLNKIKELEK